MINSITELRNFPLLFVLYYAGSSGEFLSKTLTQCFDHLHEPSSHWENKNRVKFQDFFGRSFNEGEPLADESIIVNRVNRYLENNPVTNKTFVAMAHPLPAVVDYLNKNFAWVPVIEITTHSELSRRFRFLASNSKIENVKTADPVLKYKNLPTQHELTFEKHLKIEWESLFVNDVLNTFSQIQSFLNAPGSQDIFLDTVNDYKQRNQDILNICYEPHHPENIW